MNSVEDIHDEAMNFSDLASAAKLRGNLDAFYDYSSKAFELEAEAARLVASDTSVNAEPTRSVLHRSAASIAIDIEKYGEAERLIAIALAGSPPPDIAEELRDLYEQVNFHRHLALKGVSLDVDELQFTIAGPAVNNGMILSDEFVGRIQSLQKLIYRMFERLRNLPYRDSGGVSRSIRSNALYLSVPRSGSFSVSLRTGVPEQLKLPGFDDSSNVIDEMFECFKLFNNDAQKDLEKRFANEAYYRNFVGLARNIAPDGAEVNFVGFTIVRNGVTKEVGLERLQRDISLIPKGQNSQSDEKIVKVTGRLRYANSPMFSRPQLTKGEKVQNEGKIRILDQAGKGKSIVVPEGMMSDIVRPLWDYDVEVTGAYVNRQTIRLIDIKKIED